VFGEAAAGSDGGAASAGEIVAIGAENFGVTSRHVGSIALVPGRPSEDRSVVQLRELRSACGKGSSVAGDPRDCERGAGRLEGARRWSSPSSIPSHALSRE
jgi:hypothetical protein